MKKSNNASVRDRQKESAGSGQEENKTDFPTQEEQDRAWEYCCKRPLRRPQVSVRSMFVKVMLICSGIIILSYLFYRYAGISFFLVFFALGIVSIFLYARRIVIGMVKLYQHYAPEYMRRRCLLMPTCSEYMILAVEKYGVVRGVCKGINRLFTRCYGNVYRIDYP